MWVVVNVSSLYGAEDSCGRVQFPRCGQPVVFYLEHVHFLRCGGLLYHKSPSTSQYKIIKGTMGISIMR